MEERSEERAAPGKVASEEQPRGADEAPLEVRTGEFAGTGLTDETPPPDAGEERSLFRRMTATFNRVMRGNAEEDASDDA